MELRTAWRGLAFVLLLGATANADDFASECAPTDGPVTVVVGRIACQRLHSAAVGGVTAFGYYVPPACVGQKCPVLYLTHGTGGSYRYYMQVGDDRNAIVLALTSGPAVDAETVADPWSYADPTAWIAKPAMDMVIVTPHNKTVPGGYGPTTDTDGFWSDWNPRYAAGGAQPVYGTPPPRFDAMVVDEIMPWVETHLPVGNDREHRAVMGYSQGGLGALLLGLHHPDLFASVSALSGASIPLGYMPAAATIRGVAPGVGAPAALPYVRIPGVVPMVYPAQNPNLDDPSGFLVRIVVNGLRAPAIGYGDPVADEAYYRGNTSQDLAANARAWSGAVQSVPVDLSLKDAIPYRGEVDPTAVFYEAFANYIIDVQKVAFDSEGVAYQQETFRGTHDFGAYAVPHLRFWMERAYGRLHHTDGTGAPPPAPDRFDFRSIAPHFEVWGWTFDVQRQPVEFLNVRDVSCRRLVVQGSGTVTITVPAACNTGLGGSSTFPVDLGPSMPTDEHAMASYTGLYNRATTVDLEPL